MEKIKFIVIEYIIPIMLGVLYFIPFMCIRVNNVDIYHSPFQLLIYGEINSVVAIVYLLSILMYVILCYIKKHHKIIIVRRVSLIVAVLIYFIMFKLTTNANLNLICALINVFVAIVYIANGIREYLENKILEEYRLIESQKTIRKATVNEVLIVSLLAKRLWPKSDIEELKQDLKKITRKKDSAIFIYYHEKEAVGFAQCQLRYDYVEGTKSSPVAYLEGIYIDTKYRGYGFASQLIKACEEWARTKKVREFASDCEIDNIDSYEFHKKVGFIEVNKIICFKKELKK